MRALETLRLCALVGISSPVVAQISTKPPELTIFSIRADLSQADAIAPLLAKIGQPVLYHVKPGQDPQLAIAGVCGTSPPPLQAIRTQPTRDGTTVYAVAAPCVRRLHNVVAIARDGDTLESIAVRLGMRPSSSRSLRVKKGKSSTAQQTARLSKGDRVVATLAPDWSTITPKQGTVRTRSDLVREVALAMKCGAEDDEACLLRRSVFVTERTYGKTIASIQSRVAVEGGQPDPSPPAPPDPATPEASSIAQGQWPYDIELVKILLKEAIVGNDMRRALIGVVDNGLASRDGSPLDSKLFASTYETPPVDDADDDDNNVVDDLIGAGAARSDNAEIRTGDLGLCGDQPPPDFAAWDEAGREKASHGSVVASIATGQGLRSNDIAAALPKLLFYRAVRNGCTAEAGLQFSENDIIDAAEYLLFYDIKVLNMSIAEEPGRSTNLARQLANTLVAPNAPMLVAAAGNDTGNLDERFYCPACLGNGERYPDLPRQRVIVVGAADRTLKKSDYSGYGKKTVRLFAPAEPFGALDITGRDAGQFKSATSYATPLVSLALSLAYALGMEDQAKIRNRLYLSTWPLLGDDGEPVGRLDGPLDVGVLDLVRVAAIRHQTIETLQNGIRRVYVGRIVAGLNDVCPGTRVDQTALHAIRLGAPDNTGLREAILVKRTHDPQTFFPLTDRANCQSAGTVKIEALRDGTVDIPASTITQILNPAKPR
jgi:hypothetical protein